MARKRSLFALYLLILVSCASKETIPPEALINDDILYISNTYQVQAIDLNTNQQQLIRNGIFMQSLNYDKERQQIVAPGYSPEKSFLGLWL